MPVCGSHSRIVPSVLPLTSRWPSADSATPKAPPRAFLANDTDAINDLVLYPLAYIGAGKSMLLEPLPVKPADLIASKQWHTTTDTEFEVVGVSSTKAHVILPHARRVRAAHCSSGAARAT